ncbi:MAG: hypothetical protein NXI12_14350 [Alphaproteobacteria bacterium]|nr:hypothetical protein [Alphaproteobacteria bacterium]
MAWTVTPDAMLRTGVFVSVTFILTWIGLWAAESLSKPAGSPPPAAVTLYLTPDGVITPESEPITVPLSPNPLYDYRPTQEQRDTYGDVGVFHIETSIPDPQVPTALFFTSAYEIEEVRLNGRLLKAQSPTDPQGTLSGFGPAAFVLPPEFIEPGVNEVVVVSSGRTFKSLPLYVVGAAEAVLRAEGWGRFFSLHIITAATAMLAFAAALLFLSDWREAERPRMVALLLVLVTWALRNLSILGAFDFLPFPLARMITYAVSYLPVVALVHLALAWTSLIEPGRRLIALAYGFCLAAPVLIILLDLRRIGGVSIPWMLDNGLTIAGGCTAIILFARHALIGFRHDLVETVVFMVCTWAVLIDKADNIFHLTVPFVPDLHLTFYFAPVCGLLLGLSMCASVSAQATRARRVVQDMNQTLERKLAEREQQIRSQARQVAVVDERRRIMRDMHDGLGARLTDALVRLRKNPSPIEMTQDIQSALDELRLTVDSLDSAGETLAMAIGSFRQRASERLNAAGIELSMEYDEAVSQVRLPAHDVLQVFRILQEATTNIIRHSGATEANLMLKCCQESDEGCVDIILSDNGRGLPDAAIRKGLGLQNMESRARRIGAEIAFEPAYPGLRMRLRVRERR